MGVMLAKGQRVSLAKEDGSNLSQVCVGLNWGMIQKGKLFKRKVAVDLDASCGLFNSAKQLRETVYYGNLRSRNKSIVHSGDDLTGDSDGDDGIDNEIISVDLDSVNEEVETISFVLNSFSGQDFKDIPFARLRIYEGTPSRVDNVLATYDIANDSKFAGKVSMIMGNLYRHNDSWKFNAIGEPDNTKRLSETLETVARNYL